MTAALPLRQSMAWIHGWLGLLAGWLLFAMFLTGTASYFRPEITQWMQPEIRASTVSPAQAAQGAMTYLQRIGAGDDVQWFLYLPDARSAVTRVFEQRSPTSTAPPRPAELTLDPRSGEPVRARETRGGEHFYRFHFQLQADQVGRQGPQQKVGVFGIALFHIDADQQLAAAIVLDPDFLALPDHAEARAGGFQLGAVGVFENQAQGVGHTCTSVIFRIGNDRQSWKG